jgi:type VI secretion system protein ImpM
VSPVPAGLFGKLPAKRDFVAANAPRRFLEVWEPWLQAGVATSKQVLGGGWADAYNRAPIWRFWLGAGFCGEATLGVFMPSVDGVGRSFPLSLFVGEGEDSLPPPELDSNDAWFEAAEAILLDALDPAATLEAVAERVALMPAPTLQARTGEVGGLEELSDGGVVIRGVDRKISVAFLAARRFGHRRAFASQSFWWTIGGEDFPALALAYVGLPPAVRFVDLLTGAFAGEPTAASEAS